MTVSRLVVFFALSSMGAGCFRRVPVEPLPQPAQAEDYALTFINWGYTFCDAQMLGWNYGTGDVYQTKTFFGQQLAQGIKLDGKIGAARSQAKSMGKTPCDYYASEFGYDDAEILGEYWGVDVGEAKIRIGQVLSWQGEWAVHSELKWADQQRYEGGEEYDPGPDPLQAFWSSEMTSCDAEIVSTYWGVDFFDAKVALGEKVTMGMQRADIEQAVLGAARNHARNAGTTCSWWGSDLSLDEIEQIACFYGVGISDIKAKAGMLAFEGRVGELRAVLPQAASCSR